MDACLAFDPAKSIRAGVGGEQVWRRCRGEEGKGCETWIKEDGQHGLLGSAARGEGE